MDPVRRQRILGLALPIIGGMVSQNLLNIVDTAMVGFLGDSALAAVGLGGFVVFACQALILGISTGVQSTAARKKGEGRTDRAAAILNTAILLVILVAPIFSLFLIQIAPIVFPYLNSDASVIGRGVPYLEWRLGAIIFVGINFAFRGYWNALDMSRVYMTTLIMMHACNIVLNYVLIFGNFGAPAYGVTGAGMASAISMAFGTAIYFVLGCKYVAMDGFLKRVATRQETSSLIRISLPAGLQQLFFSAGMVVMFWIIGKIGTPELAAAKVTVVLMTTLGIPMWLVPDLVSSIFIHDLDTRELARWPMRLLGLTMPIEAMGFTFMHGLLGAGDARRVMMVGVGSQWLLFLPLAYLSGPGLGFGLFTIWLLQGSSRALSAFLFVTMWRRRHWQRIVV